MARRHKTATAAPNYNPTGDRELGWLLMIPPISMMQQIWSSIEEPGAAQAAIESGLLRQQSAAAWSAAQEEELR